MSIKEMLLQEAQTIDVDVKLDSIFESVELSDNAKEQFSTVFESAVKAHALKLAESHILDIAAHADNMVESVAQEKYEELSDKVGQYFDYITKNWMAENKLAVDNGIKVQLFESLMYSLKEAFVEHNVELPAESVNIVEELEEELQEQTAANDLLLSEVAALKSQIVEKDRANAIAEATAGLTSVQKAKVLSLSENMHYSANFSDKLSAIVEMVTAPYAPKQTEQQISEEHNPNYVNDEVVIEEQEEEIPAPKSAPASAVLKYLNY